MRLHRWRFPATTGPKRRAARVIAARRVLPNISLDSAPSTRLQTSGHTDLERKLGRHLLIRGGAPPPFSKLSAPDVNTENGVRPVIRWEATHFISGTDRVTKTTFTDGNVPVALKRLRRHFAASHSSVTGLGADLAFCSALSRVLSLSKSWDARAGCDDIFGLGCPGRGPVGQPEIWATPEV